MGKFVWGEENVFPLPSKHWLKGKVHSWIAFNTLYREGQGQPFWL